ncbi:MAG: Asp23/Gls24 family envelope stress response protein [Ardenticatenia bacterium]|nr:MAG: Asp23/Gls24 family envelope stress response protein [Ardenticatenia bacterium]
MSEYEGDSVRVAPEVITTIATRAAQGVPGVARLRSPRAARVFASRQQDVYITIDEDDSVNVELNIVAAPNVNLRTLGENVQKAIQRAIEDIVGMHVGSIDVFIEDIAYDTDNQEEDA